MKVDTDITTSTTASPVGRAVILVIISVETFITDITVYIGNIMCLMSHRPIHFSIMVMLILKISLGEIKRK